VQVVGRGDLLAPGSCALCGSGNSDEGYVDTGIFYDYEGQVYFCITCTRQIAEVIGCLLPEEANILREQANEVAKANAKLTLELEAANERLRAFDVAFASVKFPDDPNASVSDVVSPQSEDASKVDEQPVKSAGNGESETSEPVKIKRRSNAEQSKLLDVTSGSSSIEL
jgi:hypothetical protein